MTSNRRTAASIHHRPDDQSERHERGEGRESLLQPGSREPARALPGLVPARPTRHAGVMRRRALALLILGALGSSVLEGCGNDVDPELMSGQVARMNRDLQLALAPDPPACRADLLLTLISGLKRSNPLLRGDSSR